MDEGTGEGTEEGGGEVGKEGEEGGERGDDDDDGELDESERVGVDGWSGSGRRRRYVANYEQARESTRPLDHGGDYAVNLLAHAQLLSVALLIVGTGPASCITHYSEIDKDGSEQRPLLWSSRSGRD